MKTILLVLIFTHNIAMADTFNFQGSTHQTPDNCHDCKIVSGKVEIPNGRRYKYQEDCNTCEAVGGGSTLSCTLMVCEKPKQTTYCDRRKDGQLENCFERNTSD